MKLFTFFLFSLAILTAEEPWGKDAEMACRKPSCLPAEDSCKTPVIGPIGECLIKFHQNVISPADGPRSHYIPSSSQYTLNAMRKYGFFTGFIMGCDRLMRENSEKWIYRKTVDGAGNPIKYDPVP